MKIRAGILVAIVIVWLIGYVGPREYDEYLKVAWNDISKYEKENINGDWKRGKVEEVEWKGLPFTYSGKKTENVMKVTFRTPKDGELGPIVYFIHPETKEIIGERIRK